MLNYEEFLGKTAKGFWFRSSQYSCGYDDNMNNYIDQEGTIKHLYTDQKGDTYFDISFNDGSSYAYPAKIVVDQFTPDISLEELFYKISKIC